jgi:predicted ArsR family transcriptional regulator
MKNDIEHSMDEEKNREKAEAVLDKMNNLIRGKSFTKMVVDERFERLQEELNELGWLGFVKTLDFKEREMHAQLKLVDPDSEEARMFLY